MPEGTSSPPTGLVLPLPVLLLQLFPKSSQTPPTPWSTGLGFPAQLSAPETCQTRAGPSREERGFSWPSHHPEHPSLLPPRIFRASQGHSEAQVWLYDPSQLLGPAASTLPALRRREGLLAAAPFPHCSFCCFPRARSEAFPAVNSNDRGVTRPPPSPCAHGEHQDFKSNRN